jgi:hypothetical protein
MLALSPAVRIYLATGTTDLQRSIDSPNGFFGLRFLARSDVNFASQNFSLQS